MSERYDLAVVGGGIIGMAHAVLAAEAGRSVVLFETTGRAVGASIRNFGLITVTGQRRGAVWEMSLRSRDIWATVAERAGIPVLQRGMAVAAQTSEAEAVLDAFARTKMGDACSRISADEIVRHVPLLRENRTLSALWSPHELRVEPRLTLPALANYLAGLPRTSIRFSTPIAAIEPGRVTTLAGESIAAEHIVVCTGADARLMYPHLLTPIQPHITKLNMLRVVPRPGAGDLSAPVVSDLTLARYRGFSDLPEASAILGRLDREQAEMLADGVHVIAVRSSDGSLVIGDSHHPCPSDALDPFQPAEVDDRIMAAANAFLDLDGSTITERWTGAYITAPEAEWLIETPVDGVTLALIIGGKGMTMSFGFAEHVLGRAIGLRPANAGKT